jgi:MoaA/NifB/PqqE/SkfB family radical SAM enzyme
LPGIGVRKVLLTGGEPLLYANVAELTRTIADQGVTVDLNSNLQRMDDRMLADLQAAGLSEISASIEGPEAIHDRMHGRVGAYRRTVAAIRKAADRGIRVDVSCCVTADNVDHLGALVALLDSLPIASLTVSRLFPIGHGLRSSAALTAERLRDIHRGLATHVILARRYPIRLVGLLGLPSPNDCDRGRSLIGLSPLGELQACVLCAEHPALASRPLESGLDVALQELRENVALHSYPLCCREEP